MSDAALTTILVKGVGGRTGQIVYEKLKQRADKFCVRGLVRSKASKANIGGAEDVHIANITQPESLGPAFVGVNVLIILTNAASQMKPGFDPSKGWRPEFYYEEGAYPEQVGTVKDGTQLASRSACKLRLTWHVTFQKSTT